VSMRAGFSGGSVGWGGEEGWERLIFGGRGAGHSGRQQGVVEGQREDTSKACARRLLLLRLCV